MEYITAGGLNHEPLDTALLQEALLMRDALLSDFSDIANIELITTYDARLTKPEHASQAILIDEIKNPIHIWQTLLTDCDAALIVAPETSGILNQVTTMVEASNTLNLGSHSGAVITCSHKYETYQILLSTSINTIPTYRTNEIEQLTSNDGFVLKPNDGAGCEDTYYFSDKSSLYAWLASHPHDNMIVQPYLHGKTASISALFKQGQSWVLSCNEQIIEIQQDNKVHLRGCRVNAFQKYLPEFEHIANQIAQALPDLNGYAGIDVIINNNMIYVVEINPRITTSYIGLHESLSYNPARLILDAALKPVFELPLRLSKNIVDIHLNA
ncbi:MAG TPA: ATP-grasp domain-containing protein [Methylotenera sp.]|nr:ATP-grasp domain-containing protein [Methylotenera sp.]